MRSHMNTLYVHSHVKHMGQKGAACLKVFNEANEELSFAFDDSCGALQHLSRVSAMVYDAKDQPKGDEQYVAGAEGFLLALANHLGYTVTKK